ncbi:unnamed protein product, partial [Symbiodinium necroappetens]
KWFSFLVHWRGLTAKGEESEFDAIELGARLQDPSRRSQYGGLDHTWTSNLKMALLATEMEGKARLCSEKLRAQEDMQCRGCMQRLAPTVAEACLQDNPDGQQSLDMKAVRKNAFESGANQLELSALVLQNFDLIDYCQSPIFATYLATTRAARELPTRVQFQADRTNMAWLKDEISLLFQQAHDPVVLRRLKVWKGMARNDDGSLKPTDMQQEHLEAFWNLVVATASERTWFLLHYVYTGPEMFAGLISDDEGEALACLARVRSAAECLIAAERAVNDPQHQDRALRAVLDNVWWNKLPLIRLMLAKLRAHSWQRGSLWQFTWKLFGHGLIHSKSTQEDVLQELQNLARSNRNPEMRQQRVFYTQATSKRLQATGDVELLKLQKGDLQRHGRAHEVTNDCFRSRKTLLPDAPETEFVKQSIEKLKSGVQDGVKPAGTEADERAVSALAALQALRRNGFLGADALWAGSLLQRGHLFRQKATHKTFISLGFESYCALGWELATRSFCGHTYFYYAPALTRADAVKQLLFLVCTDLAKDAASAGREEFEAIPFQLCPSFSDLGETCSGECLPIEVRGHGLLLKQTGAPRRLIPHMLLSKSLEGITELVLRSILTIQGAQVQKKPGEKSVTKRTLLWSVICAEFANKTVEEQSRIFLSFYKETTKSSVVPDEITSKALEHLPFDEVQSDFKGIKDRLEQLDVEQRFKEVLHREKGEKARVEYETPDAIKRLKPSQGVKTVLCMDLLGQPSADDVRNALAEALQQIDDWVVCFGGVTLPTWKKPNQQIQKSHPQVVDVAEAEPGVVVVGEALLPLVADRQPPRQRQSARAKPSHPSLQLRRPQRVLPTDTRLVSWCRVAESTDGMPPKQHRVPKRGTDIQLQLQLGPLRQTEAALYSNPMSSISRGHPCTVHEASMPLP